MSESTREWLHGAWMTKDEAIGLAGLIDHGEEGGRMSGCNATLTLYVEPPRGSSLRWNKTVTCVRSNPWHEDHVDDAGTVSWDNDATGAKPHVDPEPVPRHVYDSLQASLDRERENHAATQSHLVDAETRAAHHWADAHRLRSAIAEHRSTVRGSEVLNDDYADERLWAELEGAS